MRLESKRLRFGFTIKPETGSGISGTNPTLSRNGGEGWFSGQIRNLPPDEKLLKTFCKSEVEPGNNNKNEVTPLPSLKSDVTGLTPNDYKFNLMDYELIGRRVKGKPQCKYYLSIVNDRRVHISSYFRITKKLKKIIRDDKF